jgi:hypothetical protein
MLAYYPLEHLYYLGSHGIIPSSMPSPLSVFSEKKRRLALDFNKLGLWSCRFWAAYVVLHFAHLVEDRKLLKQRHSSIRKAKGTGLTKEEKKEMEQRWDAFWSEVVINLGYLPLTIHWYGSRNRKLISMLIFVLKGRWKRGCSKMKYDHLLSCSRSTLTLSQQGWVGVFGLIAAVASFRTGWKATALPPPPSEVKDEATETSSDTITAYDVST